MLYKFSVSIQDVVWLCAYWVIVAMHDGLSGFICAHRLEFRSAKTD